MTEDEEALCDAIAEGLTDHEIGILLEVIRGLVETRHWYGQGQGWRAESLLRTHYPRPVHVDALCMTIANDPLDGGSRGSLRTTISHVRKRLKEHGQNVRFVPPHHYQLEM